MQPILTILAIAVLITSCKNKTAMPETSFKHTILDPLPISPEKIKGTYIGDFKGSPIAITLNYITDNHASGYNIHNGLTRNISGSIEAFNGKLHLQVGEPGTNKYDGEFDLLIDTSKWTGKGIWEPFQQGKAATFHFTKQRLQTEEEAYNNKLIDSLGNYISLHADGSCTYAYLSDTTNTGQQLTVHGNFKKDKKNLTIYWQKNSVFPSQKSTFYYETIKPDTEDDFTIKVIKGEGRVFKEMIEF